MLSSINSNTNLYRLSEDFKGTAEDAVMKMLQFNLIAKESHGKIIRYLPPLIVTKEQCDDIIEKTVKSLKLL